MSSATAKKEASIVDQKRPSDPTDSADVVFSCGRCGLTESCHYLGREPPFCSDQVRFEEDSFVLRDPFTPEYFDARGRRRVGFLLLGGKCFVSDCSNGGGVCVDCSVFYKHRFCLDCLAANMDAFPSEVQVKIQRKLDAEGKAAEQRTGGGKKKAKK